MCRESSELIVPVVEEHIAIDQECIDALLSRRAKALSISSTVLAAGGYILLHHGFG